MAEVRSVPAMPEAAGKMLSLLNNPDTTASQIEKVLRYEPSLTANVLKLTNSAYFGLPSKVGSVKQAIVLLGWKRLIQIVLALCAKTVMKNPIPGYDLPAGVLWRHSISVTVAADILATVLGIPATGEFFTAALLHDVGKLVMGSFVKEDLREIEKLASNGISFEIAEYMIGGTDHAEIGAHILRSWSFPSNIVTAVRWHHDPDSAEETNIMLDIVHVANVLSLMIGIGAGREGLRYKASASVTKRLGLKAAHLETAASQVLQGVNQLADALELG